MKYYENLFHQGEREKDIEALNLLRRKENKQ